MQNPPRESSLGILIDKALTLSQSPESLDKSLKYALISAFIVRLVWGLLIPVIPISDSHAYDVFAQNIASGGGYGWNPGEPTAYWAVGTSAIYALLFFMFGHHYLPIVVLNVLIGVGTVALAWSLARRWLGDWVAVLTAWILAIWPLLVEYTTVLASELLFNFFLLAALWLAGNLNWKLVPRALSAGVLLAATSYIRPVALLVAPLAYLPEAITQKKPLSALLACSISAILMIALILPWSLRNYHAFNHFVLVSTNAGANFWMGNNPNTTGGYMELPKLDIKNEAELDKELNRQAWEYVRQEPLAFVLRTTKKALQLHDRESIGVAWNEAGLKERFGAGILLPIKLISSGYWYLIVLSACAGVVGLYRQNTLLYWLTSPPLMLWAYFIAIHSITVTGDRYHMPSIPFLAMLAAYGVAGFLRTLQAKMT
jgi:4-amino-4-deoxy-L-arabinose transferase-like glycosyltransferase